MKLRNKKTGGLANIDELCVHTDAGFHDYSSLAELNEEWEDVPEEPKERHYYIEPRGQVIKLEFGDDIDELKEELSEIGNYFETKEEAEKAVEKLKAWKRLKDKGFEFVGLSYSSSNEVYFEFVDEPLSKEQAIEAEKDLDLLFGGEE